VPHSFVKGYGAGGGSGGHGAGDPIRASHRASAEQAFTVLDLMQGFLDSSAGGPPTRRNCSTTVPRPCPRTCHSECWTTDPPELEPLRAVAAEPTIEIANCGDVEVPDGGLPSMAPRPAAELLTRAVRHTPWPEGDRVPGALPAPPSHRPRPAQRVRMGCSPRAWASRLGVVRLTVGGAYAIIAVPSWALEP
jgi:hypothetical protein